MLTKRAKSGQRLVKIYLAKVGGNAKIYDLTTPSARNSLPRYPSAKNFAKASGEIVIDGYVAPEATVDYDYCPR